ncbi:dynein heavy chain 2, axonemal-like, partial [Stegodyphus dumicola]|uniref:dynein heavy chain 2, axonemal-like n=1 Tax=Stegodyphus dumicola TaxID=202533 RepID=UPI0015AF3EBC
ALEALNKRDIGEIKSYAKPPVLVEIVLEAVMILRASEPSWAEAKRQLGSPSFLKELLEYDKDNIPDTALHKVGRYLKKPEFQPSIVGKVSIAAKSLCIWVQSMHLYGEIYKKVKPKKERLRIAQEELDRLQKTLASLLKELEELEAAIKRLEQEHELLLQKKGEYARTAKILALKLERAESIIEGLNSEKERWMIKVSDLKAKRVYVVGDSFLAAGFLSYLGPYDQSCRLQASIFWKKKLTDKKLSFSPSFDLADFFVDEEIKTEWNTHGLPSDQYSYEGAAIVTESFYCPFLVDPEGQAVKWIRNLEANRKLRCIDFQDSKWISAVEASIKQGFPILLQNMNPDLDPLLRPLLKQSDDVSLISFNDKEWEKNPNFKLYMSTKLMNPRFPCTVINHICIVNFTIKEKDHCVKTAPWKGILDKFLWKKQIIMKPNNSVQV